MNLDVALIVATAVASLSAIAVIVFLVIRYGCCGPQSLSRNDVDAFATFMELYRLQHIDIPEEELQVERSTWCKIRPRVEASRPAKNWGDLYEGAVRGFMVEPAKDMNANFQAYQLRVWKRHGDFAKHWPVMVVAQEWRSWAMEHLQLIQTPTVEARDDIRSRLQWIEAARNLRSTQVAELRRTRAWDDDDQMSLLLVFRDHIRPVLVTLLDTWDSYELQQTFGDQLRSLKGLLESSAKNSLRFMETVLRTDEVRVHSKLWEEKPKNPSELDKELNNLTSEIEILLCRNKQAGLSLQPRSLPKFIPGSKGDPDDNESIGHPPEGFTLTEKELWWKALRYFHHCDYGLTQHQLEDVITSYVLLGRNIMAMAWASVLVRRMSRFAQLGGELFLTMRLNKDHVLEMLSFVNETLLSSRLRVEEISEGAQRGWETVRRGSRNSHWSSSGPVDNLRLALNAKGDVFNTIAEGLHLVRDLKGRADKSGAEALVNEINAEMKSYLDEWDTVKTLFAFDKGPIVAQNFAPVLGAPYKVRKGGYSIAPLGMNPELSKTEELKLEDVVISNV